MMHCNPSLARVIPGLAASVAPAPLGYDEQRFFPVGPSARQRLRARFGLRGNVVLALGSPVRLLDAFALVARRDPTARLHLAIVQPDAVAAERRALGALKRRCARTGLLSGRVRFAPAPTEAERPDLFRAADVFACVGDDDFSETWALEAMASGTPTVLSIHGELHRTFTFGRHALHADPADDIDFGLTLFKALRHPRLRARLARMGAHRARSLFTQSARTHRPEGAESPCFEPDFSRDDVRAIA